jgi:hypothetical protein
MRANQAIDWWSLAAGAGVALGLRAMVRRARAYDFRDKVVLITGASHAWR